MPTRPERPATMPSDLIEVSHANGVSRFDTVSLAPMMFNGAPEAYGMHPIVPTRKGRAPYPFPGVKSALSDNHGYVLRDGALRVALSSRELQRYFRRELTSMEKLTIKASVPDLGLRVEIAHNDDVEIMDPNGAAALFISGECFNKPWEPIARHDGAKDCLPSALSGDPAMVYRAGNQEIPLTMEEMQRLVAHALRPEEYARLQVIYGDFYEISESFYDRLTGIATQPALEEDELGPRPGGAGPRRL